MLQNQDLPYVLRSYLLAIVESVATTRPLPISCEMMCTVHRSLPVDLSL
jgi:hypothetical protein